MAVHNDPDERHVKDGPCASVLNRDLKLQRILSALRRNDHQSGLSVVFGVPLLLTLPPIGGGDPHCRRGRAERAARSQRIDDQAGVDVYVLDWDQILVALAGWLASMRG